jgi:hypothetical protein
MSSGLGLGGWTGRSAPGHLALTRFIPSMMALTSSGVFSILCPQFFKISQSLISNDLRGRPVVSTYR